MNTTNSYNEGMMVDVIRGLRVLKRLENEATLTAEKLKEQEEESKQTVLDQLIVAFTKTKLRYPTDEEIKSIEAILDLTAKNSYPGVNGYSITGKELDRLKDYVVNKMPESVGKIVSAVSTAQNPLSMACSILPGLTLPSYPSFPTKPEELVSLATDKIGRVITDYLPDSIKSQAKNYNGLIDKNPTCICIFQIIFIFSI